MTETLGMSSSASTGVFGTAALAARYADDLLLGTTRDVHQAIARRVWGPVDVATAGAGKRSQVVHDAVSAGVYGAISAALRVGARAADSAERRGWGRPTETWPMGRHALSVVNGLIGDRLVEEQPDAAIAMAVRVGGADVPTEPDALATAFPAATGDVVFFVHGLMEHEGHWSRRSDELPGYGDALAAGGRWTPVYLRVNTGLALAANGVALASLLDGLVASWPVPVRRIALVGHSMGGLIIRSACAVSTDATRPWNELVTDVVTLGTPHLGAPLERLVAHGSRALGVLPESAPFGRILDTRSRGISDLRHGLPADVQQLPHVRYRLVSATLGRTVWHPLSLTFGDLLVRHPSALGRTMRAEMFPGAETLHVRSAHHFDLLNHPDVHRKLQEWLA
jgi:pimeloyl-ACP methyl ester carboxylesterase